MQALLDGDIPRREAAALRAEIESCPRCHAEFQGWEILYDDLSALPALEPSPRFREKVLEQLRPQPKTSPVLAGLFGRRDARQHATSGELQEYLDGRLAARVSRRLESHLEGCTACRQEMEGLHQVVAQLDGLDPLAPSAGFGEAVMARLRIQQMAEVALAPTTRHERALAWIRDRLPSSNRGWAAALGLGMAPAVVMALVIHSVFSFELVTVRSLLSFMGFKLTHLMGGLMSGLEGVVASTPVLGQALGYLQAVGGSPPLLAGLAVAISGTTLFAAWILYRNLIRPSGEEGHHVQVSF